MSWPCPRRFSTTDDRSAEAIWDINRAGDWPGFRDALRNFVGPPQNIVYADIDGTIGFIAAGRIPIRKNGDGWLPAPGWTGEYDWQGYHPVRRAAAGDQPAFGPFRQRQQQDRARQLSLFPQPRLGLCRTARSGSRNCSPRPRASRPKPAPRSRPIRCRSWRSRLVPLMTRIVPSNEHGARGVERLQHWDFHMDADKVEPLLFTAWLREFARSVLFAPVWRCGRGLLGFAAAVMEAVLTERPDWCDDPQAARARELRHSARRGARRSARRSCAEAYGDDMTQWQWGRAHVAVFPERRCSSAIPLLRDWLRVDDPDPRRLRHAQSRPEHDPRRRASLRAALWRRAADHHRHGGAGGVADDDRAPANPEIRSRRITPICCRAGATSTGSCPGRAAAGATLTLAPAP